MSKSDRAEQFVRWFLRFNGYFGIENFIVHDGNAVSHSGSVGQLTEIDVLGVRNPHSIETVDPKTIKNFPMLTDGSSGYWDVVIGEVKSGDKVAPNLIWNEHGGISQEKRIRMVSYVLRFIGLSKQEELGSIAEALLKEYAFTDNTNKIRYRVIVFAEKKNKNFPHLTYMKFEDMVDFVVKRGSSWHKLERAVRSSHSQWCPIFRELLEVGARSELSTEEKREKGRILFGSYLDSGD